MVAPLEPRDRPFGERADAVEFETHRGAVGSRPDLAPLCDHGGEQVPARIVFLHPDRGVAGVGLAEP